MPSSFHRPRLRVSRGARAATVIGAAIALLGIVVGTATGAVTPIAQVLVVNPPSSPVPVSLVGTPSIGGTVNAAQSGSWTVAVNNFPATQAVSGTVNVGNLPATQPVSGTVGLSSSANTVKVDPNANTVTVGNFPATQNVNVTGGSISTSQQVSNFTLAASGEAKDGTLDMPIGTDQQPFNLTAISINDGGGNDNLQVVVQVAGGAGGPGGVFVHRGADFFITFPQPMAASDLFVTCQNGVVQGDCHFTAVVVGYPSP